MKKIYILITIISTFSTYTFCQMMAFTPKDDAYYVSFGGGIGNQAILKFNIGSVPSSNTIIDSVKLQIYVAGTGGLWDGDMNFINFNDQNWLETDTAAFADAVMKTDTTSQLTGYNILSGFVLSNDIKSTFLPDYNASNTNFTLMMKDPDDDTFTGAMGPNFTDLLGNSDTMTIGNSAIGDSMAFISADNPVLFNFWPSLFVYYTNVTGVENTNSIDISIGYDNSSKHIRILSAQNLTSEVTYNLIDMSGKVINAGIVTDYSINADAISPGIYSLMLNGESWTINRKISIY